MNNQEKMAATIELLDIFDHYGVPGDRASQLLKDINLITAKFAKREKTEANIGESTMEMIRLFKRYGVRSGGIPALITEMNEITKRHFLNIK
jgi:hypothetical protein